MDHGASRPLYGSDNFDYTRRPAASGLLGGVDALPIVFVFWPVALVALGIELIVMQTLHRKSGKRVRLAYGSLLGAMLLGGFVFVATHANEIGSGAMQRWSNGINLGLFDSEDANYSFDKGVTVVPVSGQDLD